MKINNLTELRAEKLLLQQDANNITFAIKNDFNEMKRSIQPTVLLHRAVLAIIPDALINSKITGVPISFVLKALFNNNPIVSKPDPAEEKRNQVKNIALNVLESAAMLLLTRSFKKRS